jgi:regulator of replication initiation timing
MKTNEGEVPQYYVEDSHPAIISHQIFDMVQTEMIRRRMAPNRYSGTGIFSSRIICGQCGGYYGAKVWHSTSKYRRVIYQCNNKFKSGERCGTPHLDEETIKSLFVKTVNKLITEKNEIIAGLEIIKEDLFDNSAIDAQCNDLQSEITVLAEKMQKCVEENSCVAQDQKDYLKRYDELEDRFKKAKRRFEEAGRQRLEKKTRRDMVDAFIEDLKRQEGLIAEFDEQLWYSLVEYATVYGETDVRFTFKDGTIMQAYN